MDKTYPLKYSKTNPYNKYSDYLKAIFGKPMQKVSIDAGFTCPNIDGTIGKGGCTYCNNNSFNPNYKFEQNNIGKQIDQGIGKFTNRKPETGFIAYFQSHTNTHAPIHILQKTFRQAINHPSIEALIISTRPDCLPNNVLQMLGELNQTIFTGIEIGIESTNNRTLERINRRHTWEQVKDTVSRVKNYGLHIGGHLILGLPGEDKTQIFRHAKKLNELSLNTVKLHQLQIIKNTPLEKLYTAEPEQFNLFSVEEYIEICIHFIEKIHKDVVIERFSSESKPDLLAVKVWKGIKNHQLADWITNTMKKRNTWQGKLI